MKTITEFLGANLKNAIKLKQNLLASGKTPEELPEALGEALKIEGDRLTHILSAIEVVEKKLEDLKRVVVLSLAENEKAPNAAQKLGELYFVAEYFPPLQKKGAPGKRFGKERGDRKGGKRGKSRRDRGDRDRKSRGPRGDAPIQSTDSGSSSGEASGDRPPRRRFRPRGRKPFAPQADAPQTPPVPSPPGTARKIILPVNHAAQADQPVSEGAKSTETKENTP